MVTLRLHTFDPLGNDIATQWSFVPLIDEDAYDQFRESDAAADGTPQRRPYDERERRTLTLGAGLLLQITHYANFRRLLRAHRIEWQRTINGKSVWVPYALDMDGKVSFERLDEITRLRRIKITLVQSAALPFTQFEQESAQLQDQLTPDNNA